MLFFLFDLAVVSFSLDTFLVFFISYSNAAQRVGTIAHRWDTDTDGTRVFQTNRLLRLSIKMQIFLLLLFLFFRFVRELLLL